MVYLRETVEPAKTVRSSAKKQNDPAGSLQEPILDDAPVLKESPKSLSMPHSKKKSGTAADAILSTGIRSLKLTDTDLGCNDGILSNETLAHTLSLTVGLDVVASTSNGAQFDGLLHSYGNTGEIMLRNARLSYPAGNPSEEVFEFVSLAKKDWVDVVFPNIKKNGNYFANQVMSDKEESLKTDDLDLSFETSEFGSLSSDEPVSEIHHVVEPVKNEVKNHLQSGLGTPAEVPGMLSQPQQHRLNVSHDESRQAAHKTPQRQVNPSWEDSEKFHNSRNTAISASNRAYNGRQYPTHSNGGPPAHKNQRNPNGSTFYNQPWQQKTNTFYPQHKTFPANQRRPSDQNAARDVLERGGSVTYSRTNSQQLLDAEKAAAPSSSSITPISDVHLPDEESAVKITNEKPSETVEEVLPQESSTMPKANPWTSSDVWHRRNLQQKMAPGVAEVKECGRIGSTSRKSSLRRDQPPSENQLFVDSFRSSPIRLNPDAVEFVPKSENASPWTETHNEAEVPQFGQQVPPPIETGYSQVPFVLPFPGFPMFNLDQQQFVPPMIPIHNMFFPMDGVPNQAQMFAPPPAFYLPTGPAGEPQGFYAAPQFLHPLDQYYASLLFNAQIPRQTLIVPSPPMENTVSVQLVPDSASTSPFPSSHRSESSSPEDES